MTKFIEVKSANINGVFEITANKGVCWQVKDPEDGSLFLVQKKQVVRGPWEETEQDDEEEFQVLKEQASSHSLLTQALSQATAEPAPKVKREKKEPAPTDPNLVTLKQLCFDLGVIPRIARRRLRNSLGKVGTGSRWEWKKDSPEYNKVVLALCPTASKTEAE